MVNHSIIGAADDSREKKKKKKEKKKKKKKGGSGGEEGGEKGREEKGREGGLRKNILKARARSKRPISEVADKILADGISVVENHPFDARGLTQRDTEFVRNLLKGMSKVEAMKLASEAIGVEMGDRTASIRAGEALQKPQVDSAIVTALVSAGVDDTLVAEKMREGLDATAFTQTGLEHADFKTRLGYIQTVLKVKGQIGADVANQQQVLNYTSFKDEE